MTNKSRKFTTYVGLIRTILLLMPFILFGVFVLTHTFTTAVDGSTFTISTLTYEEMMTAFKSCVTTFRFSMISNVLSGWLAEISVEPVIRQIVSEYMSYVVLVVICELLLDVLLALPSLIKKWLGGVMYE